LKRRHFLGGILAGGILPGIAAAKGGYWKRNANGEYVHTELMLVPLPGGGFRPVQVVTKRKVVFDDGPIIKRSVPVVVKQPAEPIGPDVTSKQAGKDALAARQAADDSVGVSDYSFGTAGAGSAATAFAYGVAASLAGLPQQEARLKALQGTVAQLQADLAAQNQATINAIEVAKVSLQSQGFSMLDSLAAPGPLPTAAYLDVLKSSDQTTVFATPDWDLAQRLHATYADMKSAPQLAGPAVLGDFAKSALRQADAESALGNDLDAEALFAVGKAAADVLVGIDPITGALRSTYELATGMNLITGAQLSTAERALAGLNLMMLGGFSTLSRGTAALGKVGFLLGGPRGAGIIKAAAELRSKWPKQAIGRVLQWTNLRRMSTGGELIQLAERKMLVPVGAVDGTYARVMDATFASQIASGGKLAAGSYAFITEAQALQGLTKWDDVARKLSLLDPTDPSRFRAFQNEVIVEFKFVSNEPLAYLAKPFGEVGSHAPGFLPGGYTAGGAAEWVIDAAASSRGIIDKSSIRIRPLAQ
jgi:hypothetical protein